MATSRIFISAVRHPSSHNQSQANDETGQENYHRTQYLWLIGLAPHKHDIPLLPHRQSHPIYYILTPQRHGQEGDKLQIHPGHGLLGTIVIAEKAHLDKDRLQKILEGAALREDGGNNKDHDHQAKPLDQKSEQEQEREQEEDVEDEAERSELHLRKVLRLLQDQHLLTHFEIGKFVTFAHGYMASRADDTEVPGTIGYAPVLNKDHTSHDREKDAHGKKPKFGFWVTRPLGNVQRHVDEDSKPYGGLL